MDDQSHTALTWLRVLGRVTYTTLGNYLVGLTPEENHWRKGEAWSRVGAYRWAVWHFRRFLKYSDDPHVRAYLAWCYAQLGMQESALQHYRQAYARNKHPTVGGGVPSNFTMETTQSGQYPIERRAGEIERLHIQGEAMALDAAIMLDQIGVGPGWRCLDAGCGPGGITDLLSTRAGPTGWVVGLDADSVFLDHARTRVQGPANVEFVLGNAYRTGLPSGSFDLVHVRFVAGTAGEPAALLQEMIRLTRPGGIVALQEPDISTLNCYPPHPAWDRLKLVLEQAFACVGADVRLAQRLYQLARRAGLEDVHYRPFLVGVRSGDPMTDYMPATVESVRGTLIDRRLIATEELEAALAACRAHLADPDTVFTTVTVAQVWGRARPRAAGEAAR